MAWSEITSGTQSATPSSEHTLTTQTSPGVYQLVVDANALVSGEAVRLRIYDKAKTGGTERCCFDETWAYPLSTPILKTLPEIAIDDWKATLTQVGGSGRSFPWSCRGRTD